MNGWEFSFEEAPYEQFLAELPSGSTLSAAHFLTLLEQEPEEAVEDAFALLEQRDILLNIGDLPALQTSGELAIQLRREAQLVREQKLPGGLEENDPLRLYLEELAAVPVCGDPQVLAEACLAGDEAAMQRLANLMLSRVAEKAFALAGKGVLLMDLIQEGSLCLWQAILNYAGGDFEAWCDRCLDRSFAKTIVLQARANGVGQKLRQAMEDYRSVDQQLLADLGRNPTPDEIAEALHMSEEEVSAVAEMMRATQLIHRVRTENQPKEPQPEDQQAVEDTAYFQMRQRVQELLSDLSELEAKLLSLRFGLEGGLPLSPAETGKMLDMTAEEVTAAEATALAKMRNQS